MQGDWLLTHFQFFQLNQSLIGIGLTDERDLEGVPTHFRIVHSEFRVSCVYNK